MAEQKDWKRRATQIGIFVFIGAIMLAVALNMDKLKPERFQELGYMGVFLLALIGSSTVILPIPHLAFTFTMGALFNPWVIGLSAGIGDAFGELTGYMAGFALEDIADKYELYKKMESWMRANGDLTIFLLSVIPMPFFDLAAMAGGLLGYPLWRFMLATWCGKTIKAIVAAWGGYYGLTWMAKLIGAQP